MQGDNYDYYAVETEADPSDPTPAQDSVPETAGQNTTMDAAAKEYLQKLGFTTGKDLEGVQEAVGRFERQEAAEQRVRDDATIQEARNQVESLVKDRGLDASLSRQAENFIAGHIQSNSRLTWRGKLHPESLSARFWGSEEEREKVVEEAFSEWVKSVLPTSSTSPQAPAKPAPSRGYNGGAPSSLHDRAFALLSSTPPKRRRFGG